MVPRVGRPRTLTRSSTVDFARPDGGRHRSVWSRGPRNRTLNASSVAAIPYSYTVDANNNVKSIVMNGAGTGKI